jgi:hypothetical protein
MSIRFGLKIRCDRENAREKQKIQIYKIKYQHPLKSSHKDGKHQFASANQQCKKSQGVGEDVSQLSLCIDISHLNISLLNVIS